MITWVFWVQTWGTEAASFSNRASFEALRGFGQAMDPLKGNSDMVVVEKYFTFLLIVV